MNTVRTLNKIGMALSAERDQDKLLQLILTSARELTGADAGTLYIIDEEQSPPVLRFAQLQNESLNVFSSGVEALKQLGFNDIVLDNLDAGGQQTRWVVQHAITSGETINIPDVYEVTDFDVSGTKAFDEKSGYRSRSMLVVPMRDHEDHVIGALQLINKAGNTQADNTQPGNTQASNSSAAFNSEDEDITRSLASQGAVALTQHRLIAGMQSLFTSFTQVIASAIDSKSPQTGAHCRRVPDVTLMLAKAGCRSSLPVVQDFELDEDGLYELEMAAWLHDCGKIVTPHHVVEKSTKLETVYDGIETIEAKLEVLKRDAEIAALKARVQALEGHHTLASDSKANSASLLASQSVNQSASSSQAESDITIEAGTPLNDTLNFLRTLNKGGEFVSDEALARLERLAELKYQSIEGKPVAFIPAAMLHNLSVRKGTLNPEERQIMEDHMKHTLKMLDQLPFPKHLRRVPEYAGGHHEKMNGKGYPRGLTREQMSIPARMMGIADVFEALTAPERSYKQAMSLSQALTIMGRMVEDDHLDPELFELFIDEKVYLEYAHVHLTAAQIDEIDVAKLPGYRSHKTPQHVEPANSNARKRAH